MLNEIRRYLRWNLLWLVIPALGLVLAYLWTLVIAKALALGGHIGGVGITGIVTQFVLLVSALLFVVVAAIFGFLDGQPDGKPGLSWRDGWDRAKVWLTNLKNAFLCLASYAGFPFIILMGLAFCGPEYVRDLSTPLLALAFGAIILIAWKSERVVIPYIFLTLEVVAILGLLTFAVLDGAAPKVVAKFTPPSVMAAKTAKDAQRDYLASEVTTCYTDLAERYKDPKKIKPTTADENRCAEKQTKLDAFNGTPSVATPTPAPSSASSPPSTASSATSGATSSAAATASATGACTAKVLETEYIPSRVSGAKGLGSLPPGSYQIRAEGTRNQVMFKPDFTPVSFQMDADGRMPARGNQAWPAGNLNPDIAQPFVGKAYGAFVLRVGGQPVMIGSTGTISLDKETPVGADLNVFQNPQNYGGNGIIRVTINRCG